MNPTPNTSTPDEVAKHLCLQALLQQAGGYDEALACHVKTAIDFALTGETGKGAPLQPFAEAALTLMKEQGQLPPSYGLAHLDLREQHFDALWVRAELVKLLKRLAGYHRAMLVVSGLQHSLCTIGRRRSLRQKRRQADAVAYIDGVAARYTTEDSVLTILYV